MSALLNATYNTNKYHAEAVMRFLHPNLQGQRFQFTGWTRDDLFWTNSGKKSTTSK